MISIFWRWGLTRGKFPSGAWFKDWVDIDYRSLFEGIEDLPGDARRLFMLPARSVETIFCPVLALACSMLGGWITLKLPCILIVALAILPLVDSIPLFSMKRSLRPLGVIQFAPFASRAGTWVEASLSSMGLLNWLLLVFFENEKLKA